VVAFLALHVVSVVSDAYAPIGWKDAVIPFASPYRPIWLGFGALASDLVLALVVTSLLRHRLGFRTWRAVHWFAYLCWPVAVVHGLGTGTDTTSGVVLVVTLICVVAVLAATALRIVNALAGHPTGRAFGFAAVGIAPLALAIWLASGPLASGWARRAGTPENLLATARPSATANAQSNGSGSAAPPGPPPSTSSPATSAPSVSGVASGFEAQLNGRASETPLDQEGNVTVSLAGSLSRGATGSLDVELHGAALAGGGVQLERGSVVLTDATTNDRYSGTVVGLRGNQIVAQVSDQNGRPLLMSIDVTELDTSRGTLAATVSASPGGRRGEDDRGSGDR
jgi:methionine sulfoxide reductase heme-binding subunit